MHKGHARSLRIADQIQRELAQILRSELKDPRVAMITLTDVEVSTDCTHAKVFYTMMGGAEQRAETEIGLRQACGFLRSQLARRIKLRSIPELHFAYDASVERGFELSRLIDQTLADDKERQP